MFIGNSKDDSDGTDMGDTLITDMLNMVQPPKVINVRRAGRSMGTMQIVTVSVDFNDPEIISIDVEPFKDTVVRNKSKDMSKVLGAVFSVLGNEKMPMMVLTEETVKYLKSDRSIKKGKGKNAVMYAIHYAIDEGTLYEKYEGTTKLIAKKHEPIHA
jgi:hypothetical protein